MLHHHLQCNWAADQNTLVFHQHFLFGSGGSSFFEVQADVTEKQQASPHSLFTISGKANFFYED